MAKPTHPARREPGALSLLGLSILCASGAATLLLTGHPAAGGAAALAAAFAHFAAVVMPGAPASPALGATGPLLDAAVLAPIAWADRFDERQVAALALITLGAALVASYERARSDALGYRTRRSAWVRLARQIAPAAGVIAGGEWLLGSVWAALALAGLTLVVRAANVVLQERAGITAGGAT